VCSSDLCSDGGGGLVQLALLGLFQMAAIPRVP
jgi:hypothetical protein